MQIVCYSWNRKGATKSLKVQRIICYRLIMDNTRKEKSIYGLDRLQKGLLTPTAEF